MRTVEFPDEVLERVERAAAARGVSVVEWAAQKADEETSTEETPRLAVRRVPFPLIHAKHPGSVRITEETLREIEFDDDMQRSGLVD